MATRHLYSIGNCERHKFAFPKALTLTLLIVFSLTSVAAQEIPTAMMPLHVETPVALMPSATRAELEARLSSALQHRVDSKQWFGAEEQHIHVGVHFDIKTGLLQVDLGEALGRLSNGPEMEDLQEDLQGTASMLLEGVAPYKGMELRYGGRTMYDYFPEEWRPPRPITTKGMSAFILPAPPVMVSAGHGVYYNHQYKDWRAQRDPSNGIVEDYITPTYANELATWLTKRSEVDIISPRSTDVQPHNPSGMPWWKIGARYHLEALYPDNPNIWHSKPSDTTTSLRERTEDIYSRPLLANHIGVAAALHLHTNAAAPSATGTKVFFQKGRIEDKHLADSVLCSMKELIQAQENYKNYKVPVESDEGDYAENRLAHMPSIIIEVGFHTNPDDAVALQDKTFRTASMKGVEKGYRLFAEGKTCEPLSIESANNSPHPDDKLSTVALDYKGHPEFPARLDIKVLSCPAGACSDGWITLAEPIPSPVSYDITCDVSAPREFQLRTTFTDADGVKAAIEHTATCLPASQGRSPSAAVEAKAHDGAFQMPQVSD
ncbi:MAG TPA: N-acetylmuramoyl-L-alanine amidase [Dyella sp.]|uniref:N-acetylmuramoyl-L-alanine amidase family protein n=1 Tax=Dyella sp. TaxID=1869338 RepID=UPI002F92694D